MKKNLALLLVVAMALTAMIGLVPASAAASTTPSQEIAYFNISLKVGATLLFAVPEDGYTVKADGTVDNLKLLVMKDSDYTGVVTVAKGELLEASGRLEIKGKNHIIFSYSGLAANEMCDVVYACTVQTAESGHRTYGNVQAFSLTNFARSYFAKNGEKVALVEAMLNYGDAAVAYGANADVKANYLPSEIKTATLRTIKVKRVVDGTAIDDGYVLTQFAKDGKTKLVAPPVVGATFQSWSGATVTNGEVTVSGNLELTANYTTTPGTVNFNLTSKFSNLAVGTYRRSTGSSDPTFDTGVFTIGNDWTTANNRTKYEYTSFEVLEDNGTKYIKYAHNGAGELKLGNSMVGTGIGETLSFTFEINVKAAPGNVFAATNIRIDRDGSATGGTGGYSPALVKLEANGDIVLQDKDPAKNVVLGKGDSTKFQTITVVYDASEGTFTGYIDGVKKGTTTATFNYTNLYGSHEYGNSRLRISAYGGYQGSNWTGNIPEELIESGAFTATTSGGKTTVTFNETDLEASRAAVEAYILANQYVCISGAKLIIGDTMSK